MKLNNELLNPKVLSCKSNLQKVLPRFTVNLTTNHKLFINRFISITVEKLHSNGKFSLLKPRRAFILIRLIWPQEKMYDHLQIPTKKSSSNPQQSTSKFQPSSSFARKSPKRRSHRYTPSSSSSTESLTAKESSMPSIKRKFVHAYPKSQHRSITQFKIIV